MAPPTSSLFFLLLLLLLLLLLWSCRGETASGLTSGLLENISSTVLPTDGRVLWLRSQPAPATLAAGGGGRGSGAIEMVAGAIEMVAGVMATGAVIAAGAVMAAAAAVGMGGGGAGGFEGRCLDVAVLEGAGGCGSGVSATDSLMVGGAGEVSYGGGSNRFLVASSLGPFIGPI